MANVKTTNHALPTLRKGMEGDTVYALQLLLAGYGYLRGMDVSGNFTKETETAVKGIQHDNNLDDDGICGRLTWNLVLGGL